MSVWLERRAHFCVRRGVRTKLMFSFTEGMAVFALKKNANLQLGSGRTVFSGRTDAGRTGQEARSTRQVNHFRVFPEGTARFGVLILGSEVVR